MRPAPGIESREVHGSGNWGAEKEEGVAVVQRWSLDGLRFSDNRISGRISVSGSPLIDAANVEGRFSGRGLSGTLLDDEGKELAGFEGRVTANGAVGTYRDYKGGVGEWHWEGRIPSMSP